MSVRSVTTDKKEKKSLENPGYAPEMDKQETVSQKLNLFSENVMTEKKFLKNLFSLFYRS